MQNKQLIQKTSKIMLLFLTTFFLFISIIFYLVYSTTKNQDFLVNQIISSDYINEKTKEMSFDFNVFTRTNGFEDDLFSSFINEENVEKYTIKNISLAFNQKDTKLSYPNFKTELQKNVENYINHNNILYTNELKTNLVSFYSKAYEMYSSNMKIPHQSEIISMFHFSCNYAKKLMIFSTICFIICLLISAFTLRKKLLNSIPIMFTSLSLMLFTFPFISLQYIKNTTLDISPKSFNSFLSTSVQSFLIPFIYTSILCLCIALCIISIHWIQNKFYHKIATK